MNEAQMDETQMNETQMDETQMNVNGRLQYAVFPIRCFTCGQAIASFQSSFETHVQDDVCISKEQMRFLLDKHQITRLCCRRFFIEFYG